MVAAYVVTEMSLANKQRNKSINEILEEGQRAVCRGQVSSSFCLKLLSGFDRLSELQLSLNKPLTGIVQSPS